MDPETDDVGIYHIPGTSMRVPGSRPHDGRHENGGPYPKGWKGIAIALLARHAVFRTDWVAVLPIDETEEDTLVRTIRFSYRPPPSPENIWGADSK
jgi:hypothetical protein